MKKFIFTMGMLLAALIVQAAVTDAETTFVNIGDTYTLEGLTYTKTAADAVALTKVANKTEAVIVPQTVDIEGTTYTVTSLGASVFAMGMSLPSVTLPETIESIGDKAFYFCPAMTTITLPASLKTIGSQAFSMCNGLTSVTVNALVPPTINPDNTFDKKKVPSIALIVPAEAKSAYRAAEGWKLFKGMSLLPAEVAFDRDTLVMYMYERGQGLQAVAVSKATTADVTVVSEDEKIAMWVVGDDDVTRVSAQGHGTTRIFASAEENDAYEAGADTLTVICLGLNDAGQEGAPFSVADYKEAAPLPYMVFVTGEVVSVDADAKTITLADATDASLLLTVALTDEQAAIWARETSVGKLLTVRGMAADADELRNVVSVKEIKPVFTIGESGYGVFVPMKDVENAGEEYSGYDFYLVVSTDEGYVQLSDEPVYTVEAGQAVVVKGTPGNYYTVDECFFVYDDFDDNLLQVSDGTVKADGKTIYVFDETDADGAFRLAEEGTTIAVNTAYLVAEFATPVSTLGFDAETTAIKTASAPTSSAAAFTISGRKTSDKQKGLIIKKGKKTIVK